MFFILRFMIGILLLKMSLIQFAHYKKGLNPKSEKYLGHSFLKGMENVPFWKNFISIYKRYPKLMLISVILLPLFELLFALSFLSNIWMAVTVVLFYFMSLKLMVLTHNQGQNTMLLWMLFSSISIALFYHIIPYSIIAVIAIFLSFITYGYALYLSYKS